MVSKLFPGFGKRQANDPASAKIIIGVGAVLEQRYRLDAELGRGGMGIVYRARDLQTDQEVAVKVLKPDDQDPNARASLLREADTAAQLHHPNIVAIYHTGSVDTGATQPAPFIVMELVQGADLDKLHGLVYTQIIDLARQVCDALDHAHSHGLVHRDLKPGNILVEKQGYRYIGKLVDFGLARNRDLDNLPADSGVAGTVYYLAPEVIAGQPADTGADLYALGVMLYEMVTGRVPFSDFDSQSILAQHLKESVAPPSDSRADVPPALESIILRLLAKDPKNRFASAREVGNALEQIAESTERSLIARNNLPQLTTSLIGRARAVEEIAPLFQTHRLVTLTGDPGIGKTRLALALGAELTELFADGVWLVELAPWSDPAMVSQVIASGLGVHEETRRGLMVSLTHNLREKNLLLMLDHCDHLPAACAQLAETIGRECPEIRILATSAEPLNVESEKSIVLSGLTAQDSAQLLVERIRLVSPAFKSNDQSAAILARFAERLGGNPLALELVAARAQALPLKEIDQQLSQSFSVGDVIDWSYALSSNAERTLLNRMAVFSGGCAHSAIESACASGMIDALGALKRLVDHALVKISPAKGAETRYRLSESIRRYALEKLRAADEAESMRRNHRDFYLLMITRAALNLRGAEREMRLAQFEREYANILAALDGALARGETVITLRFASALWRFWNVRGYWREGYDRIVQILEQAKTLQPTATHADGLIGAGYLAILQADYAAAQTWFEQGLAMARAANDPHSEANALCGLGSIAQARGDFDRAESFFRNGWLKCSAAGDHWETAHAQYNLGLLGLRQGDLFGARKQFSASLEIFRQFSDKRSMAQALVNLGLIEYQREQYADARARFESALLIWRELHDRFETANLLDNLGQTALRQEQFDQARAFFIEGLTLFREMNSRRHLANGLVGLAGALASKRQAERAAKLIGAADTLRNAPSPQIENDNRVETDQSWLTARIQLNAEAFEAARAAGRAMSLEQALACASESE